VNSAALVSDSKHQGMGRRQGVKLEQTSQMWVWACRPHSLPSVGW
jgi:hypothetical protein